MTVKTLKRKRNPNQLGIIVADVPETLPNRRNAARPPITIHEEILSGTPTIAGSRVPVASLIDYLRQGMTVGDFLAGYRGLSPADVDAVLARIREALEEGWLAERIG
jgi:uncharacterized protein (DUF433 family)